MRLLPIALGLSSLPTAEPSRLPSAGRLVFRRSPLRCLLAILLNRAERVLLQVARLQHLLHLFELAIWITSCLGTALFDDFEPALFAQCVYFRSLV